jgi:hypothetical protein
MISLSKHIDLGRDRTRMKDPRDAARQTATARELLERLFIDSPSKRWELQLLADEVGMGKTFVALAVAYSVLEAMDANATIGDLDGCYQKILIITPPNGALFNKWNREVQEFVRRCVGEKAESAARGWFQPVPADRLDDLVVALRRRGGRGGRVVVTTMGVFGDRKLQHYDLKRRFLLGVLFRHWGNRFNTEARERLLKGAPGHWPSQPYNLTDLTEWEADQLPFTEDEALHAVERVDRPSREQTLLDELLETCRSVSEPYRRDRETLFFSVEGKLTKVYRALTLEMLNRSFPLVVVDEAHNWKNGPSGGANGYEIFAQLIAARTRRLLLLTATPFQLRPAEMLEILRMSERLEYTSDSAKRETRRERLVGHCQNAIRPALANAERASRRFSKEWSRVPLSTESIAYIWHSPLLLDARARLREVALKEGVAYQSEIERIAREATTRLEPEARAFFRHALEVFAFNEDLSTELSRVVVRHRRRTEHRLVLIGEEYQQPNKAELRPDRHVLHAALGLDVHGDGELPHYLLMRCVSTMKKGKGRSSLGSALTGCYSTLLDSGEGREVQTRLKATPEAQVYLDTLLSMVRPKDDPKHPKMSQVVDSTVSAWRDGEKTLIFCFRTNTARRLREIIDERIRAELIRRRKTCLGGEESLRALRGRMTRRDGDLVVLGLDRVLWSIQFGANAKLPRDAFRLEADDIREIARSALCHNQDLLDEKVDRVFVQRAVEHAVARRLRKDTQATELKLLLSAIADDGWVERAYGWEFATEEPESSSEETAQVDENGVHARYEVRNDCPSTREVDELAQKLMERRKRARRGGSIPVLDAYFEAPSLWLGPTPSVNAPHADAVSKLHQRLANLTYGQGGLDWETRLLVMQALRRALLRESVLLRILPDKTDRDERGWGELLAERFFAPLPRQHESMADRVAVFVEDILAASGSMQDRISARSTLLDATRLRDQNFVGLVIGGGDPRTRERIFAGFNTPLLPEVLVCTSVGAEGIDLHRHCRRVVHYDLAWNPAVLEQRTGRVDRIASKTFREREVAGDAKGSALEVGVPFLAGTYDERMYEELRMRAQTFEVLTGGDVSIDDVSGGDEDRRAEGKEEGLTLRTLPPDMLEDLRARLHVWKETPAVA